MSREKDDFRDAEQRVTGEFFCAGCRVRRPLAEGRMMGVKGRERLGCTTCILRRAEARKKR